MDEKREALKRTLREGAVVSVKKLAGELSITHGEDLYGPYWRAAGGGFADTWRPGVYRKGGQDIQDVSYWYRDRRERTRHRVSREGDSYWLNLLNAFNPEKQAVRS